MSAFKNHVGSSKIDPLQIEGCKGVNKLKLVRASNSSPLTVYFKLEVPAIAKLRKLRLLLLGSY